MHSNADFVMARQEAFAQVTSRRAFLGDCKLRAVNLQISAFPLPSSMIHIADPVAIKVRPPYVYLFGFLRR